MNVENFDPSEILHKMMNSVHGESTWVIVLTMVFALLSVFFGYKLLKVWVALAGFMIGLLVGGGLTALLHGSAWLIIIVAIVVGILLGAVAFALYKIGVFVFAGLSGFIAVTNFINTIYSGKAEWLVIAIGVIIGILIGVIAVKFVRPVIVITSSISGALSIATTVCPLMNLTNWIVIFVTAAVIAILGMIWQFSSTSKKNHEEE